MTKKEIRIAKILQWIENQETVGIAEIQQYLKNQGIEVDRKSIQRDLGILLEQQLIERQGNKRDTRYKIVSCYQCLKKVDVEHYFSEDFVSRKAKETFNFDIFNDLGHCSIFTEEEKEYLQHLHQTFRANIAQYDSQTLINKEYERIMIELSWKSSSIEGNTYSLLSTESLIKDHIFDETKTKEEAQMILNHKDCFNETIQHKESFLSLKVSDIEYLHSILVKHLGVTKNIRKVGVGITGTKYSPLDNEFQIREALEKMVDLVNQKEFFFEKSLLILLLLAYIQPFEDGNKRTSRMLSNAILLAHDSIPLSYRVISINEYKKATILFYEQNNLFYFKQLFIQQVENAVKSFFVGAHQQIINQ